MKKKSASQSAPVRRSPWLAVVFTRRRLGEGGFFKLRVALGILLCFAAITIVVFASTAPQVQRQNPYSDAWLAANHGKYDNIWTAEYETRLQPATPGAPLGALLGGPLNPLYGPDVRMSNGNVLGSNQNEFQIDVNPLDNL